MISSEDLNESQASQNDNIIKIKTSENSQSYIKIQTLQNLQKIPKKNLLYYIIKKKYKNINILEIFFLLTFNLLYIKTLKTCYESDESCISKYRYILYRFPIYMIFAMLIWFLYFIYHIKKEEYKNSLIWFCNLFFYYLFFRGYNWKGHGSFNMLLSISCVFWFFVFLVFFLGFKKIFFFNRKVFGFFIFLIMIVLCLIFVFKFLMKKKVFFKGFKDTKLINNDKLCKFKNFKINWHESTKGLLRFFPVLFSECKKNHLPSWKKEGDRYQYPDTRKFNFWARRYSVVMAKKIQNEMKILKKDEIPSGEIWVDFRKEYPELKIQIIPDIKLMKIKEKLIKKQNINQNHKGLYILFIDALSRSNFLRMYPTVFNFLEKFYNNKNSDYEVFQFFRFHSIKPHTSPNVGLWRYGDKDWNSNKVEFHVKLKNIESEFSKKGYITAHADGFCKTRVSYYNPPEKVEKNIESSHWDHEFIAPVCDEEVFNYNNAHGPFIGPYSSVRRCLFGKDISSYMLNYMEKFHSFYKNKKTISSIELSDNHELTREVPLYIQKSLLNHFKKLMEENILNKKSLIFLADHGQHMTPFLKNTTSGTIEKYNPVLILILPRVLADLYRDNLKKNEQRLVGMMDVRKVMFFLAEGKVKEMGGVNFVKDEVEEDRLPSDVDVKKRDWQCSKP